MASSVRRTQASRENCSSDPLGPRNNHRDSACALFVAWLSTAPHPGGRRWRALNGGAGEETHARPSRRRCTDPDLIIRTTATAASRLPLSTDRAFLRLRFRDVLSPTRHAELTRARPRLDRATAAPSAALMASLARRGSSRRRARVGAHTGSVLRRRRAGPVETLTVAYADPDRPPPAAPCSRPGRAARADLPARAVPHVSTLRPVPALTASSA